MDKFKSHILFFVLKAMYCSFFLTMALYPFGKAFRTIGSGICLGCVLIYYFLQYKESMLFSFKYKNVIFLFLAFIFFNTIFSGWVFHSFKYVFPTVYECWPLFFAGLEVVRTRKEIILIGLSFCFAGFFEGLTGVFQYFVGFDPINGTKYFIDDLGIRLTGSMSTYRVGNYMAIVIFPSLMMLFFINRIKSFYSKILIVLILYSPSIFLIIGSKTRSAILGIFIGLYSLSLVNYQKTKKIILFLPVLFLMLLIAGPDRISLSRAMGDGRWELWDTSIKIFLNNIFFGAGASTFKPAYKEIGISLLKNPDSMSHPHGIYIQLLADGGIFGFSIAVLFLFGLWLWCAITIFRGLNGLKEDRETWSMSSLIWAGYSCYLGTGFFGHNFYQTWWLGLGLALLGSTLGACISKSSPPEGRSLWR